MHYVYIIYSPSADKFYTGETADIEVRLQQHRTGFFRGSATSTAKDWQLKLTITLSNRANARQVEAYIKSMKSRTFLNKLIHDVTLYDNFKTVMNAKFGIKIS